MYKKHIIRDEDKWGWPNGKMREELFLPSANVLFPDVLGPDLSPEEIAQGRAMFDEAFHAYYDTFHIPEEQSNAGEFVTEYASGCIEEPDAPPLKLRIRLPKERKAERLPVLIYIYGPGFAGDGIFSDSETTQMSYDLNCIVVTATYRYYPENKYPAQTNDMHATYQWIIDNADKYGMDTARIGAYGWSTGGLYALSLAHRLQRYGIAMSGVVVGCPTIYDFSRRSSLFDFMREDEDISPLLSVQQMQMLIAGYLSATDLSDPRLLAEAMPSKATIDELKGMTPVFMHLMELDPFRDGGLSYCMKLLEADGLCKIHLWPGASHNSFVSGDLNDPYKVRFREEKMQDLNDVLWGKDLRRPWTKDCFATGKTL